MAKLPPRKLNMYCIPYSQIYLQFFTWMLWICEKVSLPATLADPHLPPLYPLCAFAQYDWNSDKTHNATVARYVWVCNIQFTRVADMPNRRRLRSASSKRLDVPSFCLPTVGTRAFSIAGAKVWNSLPDDVTSAPSLSTFQRHLKTYLFRCCYNTVWYCSYLLCL